MAIPAAGLARHAGTCDASTQSASGITSTSATLNGTRLNNAGAGKFDYGLTAAYGTTTTPAASGLGAYSTTISGLSPSTTYHYRASCNTNGSDVSFTTLAAGSTGSAGESADLGVVKTVSPASVAVGSTATFKIVATNVAGVTVDDAYVTDQLPAGLSLVTATSTQGSCSGTTLVTCTIGTLTLGKSATITIVVSAATAGSVTNTANVGSSHPDPNIAGNNHSSASLVVTGGAGTTTAPTTTSTPPTPPPALPRITRTVSAKVNASSITGTVGTRPSEARCSASVQVLLERVGGPGTPPVRKRTGKDGAFSFARPKAAGSYRVVAPPVVVGGRSCLGAVSGTRAVKAS